MTEIDNKVTLMDRARIERTIKRISYQIAETAKEKNISLVGLNERGYAVAQEISTILKRVNLNGVSLFSLDVERALKEPETIKDEYELDNSIVVVIDDVIFSGKTMFSALQFLLDQPDYTVYTGVLIDRGHRTLPVRSEFIGMEIPTKPKEHVELALRDGVADEVFLYRKTVNEI